MTQLKRDMKATTALGLLLTFAVFLAGCKTARQTARPPTAVLPSPGRAEEPKLVPPAVPKAAQEKLLQERIRALEQGVAEQRKLQTRLSNELNRATVDLQASQSEFQRLQAWSRDAAQKMASQETALNAIKEEWGRQHAGGDAAPWMTVSNLQTSLFEERRKAEAQRLALQQRDREIRELQRALSAQVVLKSEPDSRPSSPAAPASPEPAAAVEAAPAGADAPAAAPEAAGDPAELSAPAATAAVYIPADQLTAEGNRLLQQGHNEEAERLFASALARDPEVLGARQGLATCRYLAGDYAEALRLATEVLKADPRSGQASGLAGISAWRQGDLKTATRMLETAVKRDEDNAQWHIYLGIVYYAEQKQSPALRELRKAVELNPNLAEARFNLAIVLAMAEPENLDEARQNYQASLRLGNPRDERIEKMLYP